MSTGSISLGRAQVTGMLHLGSAAGLVGLLVLWQLGAASAAERVLRFHHFMPETAPQHQDMYLPFAERITKASHGRIRIEVTGDMKLGGKASDLILQVESHKVDIVFTLAGYTPGRFPRLEVFELPWIASSRGSATSQALYEFYERYAREELANVHLLAVWCHPSGVIMSHGGPMVRPADAAGRRLRVPSLVIGEALHSIGAVPKLIPLPQVIEQFEDGAIDGALFPYELIPTMKLTGHVRHITEFAGHRGLYTAVFLLVMSKQTYESLDDEERNIIDAWSGAELSAELGRAWDELEEVGRDAFTAAGGEVTFVKGADYEAWVRASEPAIQDWKAKVSRVGIDGDKLIAAAKELVAKYTARARSH